MNNNSPNNGRFYYRWEWQLQSEPEAFWPFFADTNRLNRDTGMFSVEELPLRSDERVSNGRHRLKYRLPIPIIWQEEPFEWIAPYEYGVLRQFENGPLRSLRVLATITPRPKGGATLVYETWAEPRNFIGHLVLPIALGIIAPRRFGKAVKAYDAVAINAAPPQLKRPSRLVPYAEERLQTMAAQLLQNNGAESLVARLLKEIRVGDDLILARLRPYALADQWGVDRRDLLELFLSATRVGLLDFQWEMLCPLCRGAAERVHNHLSELSTTVHCRTCNIDFEADTEHSIELTFTPNPSIRQVERMEFCVAGPQQMPHVAAQILLSPGARRTVAPQLSVGRYRARTMLLSGCQYFRVAKHGKSQAAIQLSHAEWNQAEEILDENATFELHNQTGQEQLFFLEKMEWGDQAVTAAEVIVLQRFRDLFAQETLQPGDQFSVGSLTVLFTDLRDSTRMYREIGDAPAFGVVRNHFDVLRDAIAAEDGAIVKTIGDAVMAVFRRPVSAMRAIREAQQILADPANGERPLQLKAAVHAGHSIAVTLNERLDYFGTNINIAARLEKFSQGDDMILSNFVYCDPEVQEFIANPAFSLQATSFNTELKGFDDECFNLWRIAF
ncbi:MAG: adenylate/guanylate cyclase domain-containing protein [Chloroflexi bacterium]|nr:adenylate/guanylate cyclase domain-containing protein [Chloroflexota bacterium]